MSRMLRSAFLKSLLVLALLFAQQGALTHAIGHSLAEKSQDQSQPHDRLCDLCAAYAQIGSAIGSHAHQFKPVKQQTFFVAASSVSFRSGTFTAFAARAPPYSA